MGNLTELMATLDGFDEADFPNQVAINPDPAIAAARLALAGRGDPQLALRGLEEQIRSARLLMQAARFDVVEKVVSEKGWSREKPFALGADLHKLSALLHAGLKQYEPARAHLLRAIACRPNDPNLSFHLVDIYCEEGHYADGYCLLDRTYEVFAPDRPERFLGLYRIALDALIAREIGQARSLHESTARQDGAGIFAELAQRQLRHIADGADTPPDSGELERRFGRALDDRARNDPGGALSSLYDVLAWHPVHDLSWLLVGELLALGGGSHEGERDSAGHVAATFRRSIDEDRRGQLTNAVQALRIAASFDANPKVATGAQKLLVDCYLELAEPAEAVLAATAVSEAEPDSAVAWANLASARLANREIAEAEAAAARALSIDGADPVAKDVLARLRSPVAQA